MISSTKIKRQNGETAVYSPTDITKITHIRKNNDGTFSASSDNGSTWNIISPATFLALNVTYDNAVSALIATDAQSAIDELASTKASKGTKLSDYGITDAFTTNQTYDKETIDGLITQVASQAFPLIEEYKDVIFDGVISPAEFNVIPINGTYAVLSGGSLTGTPLVLNKYTDGVSDGLNLLVENRQSIIVNTDDPETALTELTEYYVLHEQWVALSVDLENFYNKADIGDLLTLDTESKTVVGAINEINSGKQNKNDNGLMTYNKGIVSAINELFYKIPNISPFDKVIRTQGEWDAMVADPSWNGARSVAIVADGTGWKSINVGGRLNIPSTVTEIVGFGYISLNVYIDSGGLPGIYGGSNSLKIKNLMFNFYVYGALSGFSLDLFTTSIQGSGSIENVRISGNIINNLTEIIVFNGTNNISKSYIELTANTAKITSFKNCKNAIANECILSKDGDIAFENCASPVANFVGTYSPTSLSATAYKDCSNGSSNRVGVNIGTATDNCTKWSSSND